MIRRFFVFWLLVASCCVEARLPEITPKDTSKKIKEILKSHASHSELTPVLAKRILINYIDELDPNKSYFIESDITQWLNPNDVVINQLLSDYKACKFCAFDEIHAVMLDAITRRERLEKQIDLSQLPRKVDPKEFKDMTWTTNTNELLERLKRIKALQIETTGKLNEEMREKSLRRIAKHRSKREEDLSTSDPQELQKLILSYVLKATASALDSHTSYFTPDEAAQFMISVQQRLFGIGAQLRDNLNGFSVVKIIDGGPAANGGELQAKDRIVAVDGEPVVGMDITDAVELIRGKKDTPVVLTVIREVEEKGETEEEKLDITIMRGEVVLKESRYQVSHEPFGDGVIGYLKLFSFYQDPDSSSTADLSREIEKLKKEHKLKGMILDLRNNAGGMLSQAVGVTGLFITKGVVVSIKDNTGTVQHLRDLDGKTTWDGPLIVLVNRGSASASEIVAQTLQDYGRAIIVGDDHTYGKGSFQTFTLNTSKDGKVNPQGEYKVTRGRYYTVSGKTPQLTGVVSDIPVPGVLSELEIGEQYTKFPLENDSIKPNFDDDLSDVPFYQRDKIRMLYKFDLQPQIDTFTQHVGTLRKNSSYRIENNRNYQNFIGELKRKEPLDTNSDKFGENDLQLSEAHNVVKDLIILTQ